MNRIQKRASRQWYMATRRAALPNWTNAVGFLGFIVLVAVLGYQLVVAPAPARIPTVTPPPITAPSPGHTPSTVPGSISVPATSLPTTPATTPSPTANGSVTIPLAAGGTQSVPAAAYGVAYQAALATFTGHFSAVPMAPGASPPSIPRTYPSPSVSSPQIKVYTPDQITFTFTVAPGAGAPVRTISTTVLSSGTSWGWSGD